MFTRVLGEINPAPWAGLVTVTLTGGSVAPAGVSRISIWRANDVATALVRSTARA